MQAMSEKYAGKAVFLIVYIREAHASDVWPLGKVACIRNHQSLQERIDVAKSLRDEMGVTMPILVDTMENSFDERWNAWPERFYVLQNLAFELVAEPSLNDDGFDRNTITSCLDALLTSPDHLSRGSELE